MDDERQKTGSRLLIMDDDEMIRYIAEQTLSAMGHEVACVAHGMEAVETYRDAIAAGKPFDAVFLDLNIPGEMGGEETIKLLQELDPQVKGFAMSGDPTDPIMLDCKKYGFYGAAEKKLLYLRTEMDSLLRTIAGD